MTKSGIYRFVNFINGKMYIGSAVTIKLRKKNHLISLRLNKHYNKYLQATFNKYGEENILFEVLEYVENKVDLIKREQYWIDRFKSHDRNVGYNLSPTAGSPLGVKHTAETIQKAANARKGYKPSIETKAKIAKANTGKSHSKETKQKLSNSLTGRTLTEEHIFNRSANQRNYIDWPCFNGYYCKCRMCMDKRAAHMREFRKLKKEK